MQPPEPVYLTTTRAIRKEMKVSLRTLRQWITEGAPIGVEALPSGKLRYCAEKHALMRWRIASGNRET